VTIKLDRRRFLHVVAASAGAAPLACTTDDDAALEPVDQVYPQGVASGDPTPASVVLWTRVEPLDGAPETVQFEVAQSESFAGIVASGSVDVDAAGDHTLRVKVEGLEPYTSYFYRFSARGVLSMVGRTKTAPTPDADVTVRFAFASCQDFNARYYHSYRALLYENPVDFVVHLGDYMYETNGDPTFQQRWCPSSTNA
jgi:alkaline phosphatase D